MCECFTMFICMSTYAHIYRDFLASFEHDADDMCVGVGWVYNRGRESERERERGRERERRETREKREEGGSGRENRRRDTNSRVYNGARRSVTMITMVMVGVVWQ